MTISQTQMFKDSQADSWFRRNAPHMKAEEDVVTKVIKHLQLAPKHVLEIGCANGWRLAYCQRELGSEASGLDPSSEAIEDGTKKFPGLDLRVGTAEALPYADDAFDCVILGACMCLIEPALHFRVTAEIDRVLSDGGFALIYDFVPPRPYHNEWAHGDAMKTNKMVYSTLLTAHPGYSLVHRELRQHSENFLKIDERQGVDALVKDLGAAFPANPWKMRV